MKQVLTLLLSLSTLGSSLAHAQKSSATEITVYKSPTCGCCGKWEDHLRKNGFKVTSKPTEDMSVVKKQHNVPADKSSCHTALIDGYVIEGHVPAKTIRRLLNERPKDVHGLAVPNMPLGSPGMEAPGEHPNYDVLALKKNGKSVVYSSESPAK